ncbi:MAG: YfiR family protein [Ignavibacteria bacterium]|nr:YfiR family protein [Ignavibacteria bacterium]
MASNRIVIILLSIVIPQCVFAQSQKFSEYEIKAAFLEKFTRFVEWPAEVNIEDMNKPFVIGVIGENPFNSILAKMYSEQKIKSKKVEIRSIFSPDELPDCHLLVIAESVNNITHQLLTQARKLPILTINVEKEYSIKGVQISLFVESNYIRFEIDKDAAKQSGLYFSSLLLKMSKTRNAEESK